MMYYIIILGCIGILGAVGNVSNGGSISASLVVFAVSLTVVMVAGYIAVEKE